MTEKLEPPYLYLNGNLLLVADGLLPPNGDDKPKVGKFGILAKDIRAYWSRGQGVSIAQLYELIVPGLILSRHIFQGLKRNLFDDDKKDGDTLKFVYSRTPSFDVSVDKKNPNNPRVIKVDAPKDKVFVVIISPNNRHRAEYPVIDGWLDRWNWVEQDFGLQEAPINWVDRYEKKLFTRS